MQRIIMLMVLAAVMLTGCSSANTTSEYPLLPAPPVIVWENKSYVVSELTVEEEKLDQHIGTVKRFIDPQKAFPERDEDSTIAPVGSKFYTVKDYDSSSLLAVYRDGEYRKAMR
ncbi:hypothetical protein [Paenibacillus tepidiphilus]|uniref:hypothetical protein n=1 Tax=Paenibacillus tepidiphilus TaxID=2608683 RepID=UPI00123ADA06|nr:hypothetical protein [Paenibacillus tepidiphilus]